jgi:glycosyltransferase involved in cell wall biosynthesis
MLFTPNIEGIFFSTSPPMIGLVAALAGLVRRVPIAYWAMDLNPDQLYALGKLRPTDFTARLIEAVNRFILSRSNLVITLDRFMAESLRKRHVPAEKMLVLPPWPHEEHLGNAELGTLNAERNTSEFSVSDENASSISVPGSEENTSDLSVQRSAFSVSDENPFRARHGLVGKFVIMYSGNHSPSNPLDTLLQATLAFKDDDDLRFLFVGGGLGKRGIERFVAEHQLGNVICLPYQPLSELKHSLRAADVHVVSLGDAMVGIVHPCKIYGALAVEKPILFLGPAPSHIADLMAAHDIGWRIVHGDVAGAVETIRRIRETPADELTAKGRRGRELLSKELGQARLLKTLGDRLEQTFGGA